MDRIEAYYGICPYFNKRTKVRAYLQQNNDFQYLQPAYSVSGVNCDLILHGKTCPLTYCPLVPEEPF